MGITVMSAGAVQAIITELAGRYTAGDIGFTFGTVGSLREKVAAGDRADILILTDAAIAAFVDSGLVAADTVVELGKVGVGVAVPSGTPLPDIVTPEAFRQALLNAASIVYADPAKGASSGIHFASLLPKLGLADALKPKTILAAGGRLVMEELAGGRAALGINQITEILPVPGVTLVGPLPGELQKVTTYAAGVMTTAADKAAAVDFLRFVAGPAAASAFTEAGFGRF